MRDNNGMLMEDPLSANSDAMTLEQCARFLGVSRWTVYRLKARREIPYTPYGRVVRFYKPVIAEWLRKRSVKARD